MPFRREDGEAAALRHVRHHSKYLATGRLWERLQMTFAQVHGMALNGLGFVYLAVATALVEWALRGAVSRLEPLPPFKVVAVFVAILVVAAAVSLFLRWMGWLPQARKVVGVILVGAILLLIGLLAELLPPFEAVAALVAILLIAAVSFLLLLLMYFVSQVQKVADGIWAGMILLLLALLAWRGLDDLHKYYASIVDTEGGGAWLIAVAAVPLLASALLVLVANLPFAVRSVLMILSILAAPLLFLGVELAAYHLFEQDLELPFIGPIGGLFATTSIVIVGGIFWAVFDINFTAPHRHYKKKLGQAYLIQPDEKNVLGPPPRQDVSLKLSKCTAKGRAPYHLINCALNVPASRDLKMQGRLTDFFLFSPGFCGSPLTGYQPTEKWEELDKNLDLGTAMAISGAAAAPQMGTGTMRHFTFWLALFNVRLGYWIRKPDEKVSSRGSPPGLFYLVREMFSWADENQRYINVSDGGHIENLGIYELIRRRCKYIIAIDGEQDPQMTFHGLTTLQRLAAIDLGVTMEIGVDDLRLGEKGLSHSHFAFCRINYPKGSRDGTTFDRGYLIYLKLSLTGNEGEFIRRYRLDEPHFPHHSTADQFFTEAQFEAYRSLGEHIGDKLFLPAIIGPELADKNEIDVDEWFLEIGKSMLEPLPDEHGERAA